MEWERDSALLAMAAGLTLLMAIVALPSFLGRGGEGGTSKLGRYADALAGGIFLGAGLTHMLLEAMHGFQGVPGGEVLPFVVAGAVLLLLNAIERFDGDDRESAASVLIASLVLIIHALLTGVALGVVPEAAALLVLAVGLVPHKAAEAFAYARLLVGSSLGKAVGGVLLIISLAALPAGVVLGGEVTTILGEDSLVGPIALALGAGTFLHLGLSSTHIGQAVGAGPTMLARMAGFAGMAALSFLHFQNHSHGHEHDHVHHHEEAKDAEVDRGTDEHHQHEHDH